MAACSKKHTAYSKQRKRRKKTTHHTVRTHTTDKEKRSCTNNEWQSFAITAV